MREVSMQSGPVVLTPELARLLAGEHPDPHSVLGHHDEVIRARCPGASAMQLLPRGSGALDMDHAGAGLFVVSLPSGLSLSLERAASDGQESPYRFEASYPDGRTSRFEDPYRYLPTLGDMDLYLFGEGRHRRLWDALGSHVRRHGGTQGCSFAVWAPTARSVRVVGDWNGWDGRAQPMRSLGASGVWEIFVPGVRPGAHYKYEILAADGSLLLKADPFAREAEIPPATASVVAEESAYPWGDGEFLTNRNAAGWPGKERISVYEVHLGSWRRVPEEGSRPLSYAELAEQLPPYAKDMGFTHVELMPVAAHPFEGSWGYQVSSYYAPSPRQGGPDDLRALVDSCHRAGLGVYIDWVPAHFPRDEWALARFDGSALYEHADPRQGEHPDWGTLVFNYGRHEVRNFLVASALYWIEEFHVDGLRVDAVASMLYLDYSREPGSWIPNPQGGRENLEAVAFLEELNQVVSDLHPGVVTIAEESTAWPGVSRPTYLGGLGFSFKWNMGWMHDTLEYFSKDPVHRRFHQSDLTFGLLYAFSENFVLPLSHDEVVHGKRSLLDKMAGDTWQKLANLRALLAWMWAHPGKQLLFMGGEIAQWREWSHEQSLDWHLLDEPSHRGVQRLVADLNKMQERLPALYEVDFSPSGFRWIDAADADSNVLSFLRYAEEAGSTAPEPQRVPADRSRIGAEASRLGAGTSRAGAEASRIGAEPSRAVAEPSRVVAVVANLSPIPRYGYRLGLPAPGGWKEVLDTDSVSYGGSGVGNEGRVVASPVPSHGFAYSASFVLPPLSVSWFTPEAPP